MNKFLRLFSKQNKTTILELAFKLLKFPVVDILLPDDVLNWWKPIFTKFNV